MVVDVPRFIECVLQRRVGFNLCACRLEVSLGHLATKVQRVHAHTLSTDRSQIQREQTVGSIGTASGLDHILALEDVYDLADVGSRLGLNQALGAAVLAGLLHDLRHTIRDGLRGEVHALVVHPQVVHRLQRLGLVDAALLERFFQRCQLVHELGAEAHAKEVVLEVLNDALLFGN